MSANPADFGLKENPFGIVPDAEVKHWAGMPETKSSLRDVVASVRPDDIGASEFVVLLGDYGAGKSHALRFFSHQINQKGGGGCAIYLGEVMVGSGLSFSSLCLSILDHIKDKMSGIHRAIKDAVDKSVNKMQQEHPGIPVRPEAVIEQQIQPQDREMVKSLYGADRVPQMGNSDHAVAKNLASLFRVMTSRIGDSPPPYAAVYLFLDEVEVVLEARQQQQAAFFGALRILINEVTEHFGMVLSFSQPVAVLEATIPEFLKERMTRKYIACEKLPVEGAKQFVQEFLGFVRIDGFSPPQPLYPFSESAVDAIFDHETALVPRRILMHLRRVFERSIRVEGLKPGEDISREMAENILQGV